jgi:(2Fe-2S) ferredoxin
MKTVSSIIVFLFVSLCLSQAQQQDGVAYNKVLTDRAQKIVNTLGIKDEVIQQRVTNILVHQYKSLGLINDGVDADTTKTKNEKLYNLHCEFIGNLSSELTPEQVIQVKDGMTYGVVKVTYDSYCDMIPSLKEEEKRQLIAWLVEAREHAMDAYSSNKKHELYGKYKGLINNYLSQRGYDIQQERKRAITSSEQK